MKDSRTKRALVRVLTEHSDGRIMCLVVQGLRKHSSCVRRQTPECSSSGLQLADRFRLEANTHWASSCGTGGGIDRELCNAKASVPFFTLGSASFKLELVSSSKNADTAKRTREISPIVYGRRYHSLLRTGM